MFGTIKRLLWLVLGHFFLVIGVIGVFLPVFPTVPFIIIASGCYAKGSEKFHQRMRNHRWVGDIVRDWEDHGAISLRSKWIAVASLSISVVSAVIFLSILWVQIAIALVALCAGWFILTRRTAT